MKKFARTLMVTLTALCLSVCFLFAGCSKHAGTYTGVTLLSQTSIELKLKANDEFELSVGDNTTKGTWEVSEDDENVIVLKLDGSQATAAVEDDALTIAYIGLNSIMASVNGAKLTKK